ncbi:MAG: diguanylate cyclase [Gammaproteobacteria bacterium]
MDNTQPNAAAGTTATAPPQVAITRAEPHEMLLAGVWGVAALVAVVAAASTLANTAHPRLLVGWAAFTLMNAGLLLASRAGMLGSRSAGLDAGVGALQGLAWGAGVVLLLPTAGVPGLAVLLGAGFALALLAIPLFGEHRLGSVYLLATLATLTAAGVLGDGRFLVVLPWLAIAAGCLLLTAGAYHGVLATRRGQLVRLLEAGDSGAHPISGLGDTGLGQLAERRIGALAARGSSQERDGRVLGALGEAVVSTDAGGAIDYVNPIAEVLLGRSRASLAGAPIEQGLRLVTPPDRKNHARAIFDDVSQARRARHGGDNVQLVRHDGVVYGVDYVATPLRDAAGDVTGTVFLLRDVTEKRHRAESIAWQATHDPLTGAINRAEFEIRLKKLLRHSQDDVGHVHSLLYIDVDKFKFVNDSYGHAAGDAALNALADVLRTRIRGADTLARIGGDEFAALLYSCSGEKARLIAEGLRIAVERHEFSFEGVELPLSLSIGVVEINQECRSLAEIVRAADAACFAAKEYGRNRVHVYQRGAEPTARHARVFDFVKDIQTAIHGNRLELFYRPLLGAARSAGPVGCELSVGIRNIEGGIMARQELDELARRYHLREEIDRWVVKAAIDALRLDHPALRDMPLVLIPLSPQSMSNDRLLAYVIQLVREHAEQAPRIGFAFEDNGFASQLECVRYFVSVVKEFGCRFMLSDLCFSSDMVSAIKSLQADFLGIRASLVNSMLLDSVDYEVVLGLSRIAQALGLETIAERADSRPAHDALARLGVDYVLGEPGDAPRPVSIQTDAQWV